MSSMDEAAQPHRLSRRAPAAAPLEAAENQPADATAELRAYDRNDVSRSRHVIDAVLAPDASFAVYQLSEFERGKTPDEDRQVSALWRVDLAGGDPRRLTAKGSNASAPQIAPDGSALFFLSARDPQARSAQVWRLPLTGGEAEPVTSLEQGVADFALSPDGAWLALAAMEQKEKPPGPKDHVRINRAAWRFDPVPGYLQDVGQAIHIMPATGGEAKALTPHDGVVQAMAWSPDSGEIAVVVVGRAEGPAFPALGDLAVVDRDGHARTLVEGALIASHFWTTDGKRIGYVGRPPGGSLSSQTQLLVIDRGGGTPISRTPTLDLAVGGAIQSGSPAAAGRSRIVPTEDGAGALVAISKGGETGVWRVELDGPERCAPVISGERTCKVLDLAGDRLLFASQDFITPAELRLADLASGSDRAIADHNAAWRAEVAWPRIECLSVESAPGVEIEGWVMVPRDAAGPMKTVLFIHGGPHAGWGCSFNEDFLEMAGAGWAVAFANPRGSAGYGDGFSEAIVGSWGHPEFEDFMAFLDALVARRIADGDRLAVTGVSGGGHLTAWLIGHTERFKAAVPEQGVYNMFSMYGVSDAGVHLISHELGGAPHEAPERYWAHSPLAHAHKCRTPTLLIQGENDVRCPMEQAEQLYTVLKQGGCEVELLRLRNCNHGLQIAGPPPLRRVRMAALRDWLDRYVP